jgi:16S rRNA (uracil1498-N3)-methyltransferase
MEHPFFFEPRLPEGQDPFPLGEESARHVITVLRMRHGDRLFLTDGRGALMEVEITAVEKKKAFVQAVKPASANHQPTTDNRQLTNGNLQPITVNQQPSTNNRQSSTAPPLVLAVSLLKNSSRFEWILEKATEIGVSAIIPLVCERTERIAFRQDRLQQIIISAMLQSQQVWLPDLTEPTPFRKFAGEDFAGRSYIAHCLREERHSLYSHPAGQPARVLIGPEGDFTPQEIRTALDQGFIPVTLGNTRLRTETAAIVAVAALRNGMDA